MSLRVVCLAMGVLVATSGVAAREPVSIRSTVDYYDVRGDDANALLASMNRGAPVSEGKRVFGRTSWHLQWAIRFRQSARACTIESADVDLDETVTLPRWQGAKSAAPQLSAQWAQFLTALEAHERGHADRAKDAARDVHAALLQVATTRCDDMNRAADAVSNPIIARYSAADSNYDAATQHGRTQGAVWPPPR